ncbi:uncharacterized protein VTP21DRAFT_9529 [Calcarisporiella thermophila]|uniref:uncharacterized protein n=1 Tax=Calcarisporiella thermophila TaxID=911321 RepID=UPI003742CE15
MKRRHHLVMFALVALLLILPIVMAEPTECLKNCDPGSTECKDDPDYESCGPGTTLAPAQKKVTSCGPASAGEQIRPAPTHKETQGHKKETLT